MRQNNMTQGSAAKHILFFSLPLLAGNLFQQLYNMVDSVIVGQFVGTTALAAVGVAFPVVFLLISIFMGIGTGSSVLVSQYFGAGNYEKMRDSIDSIYTALIVGFVPISVLGVLLIKPITVLLQVPESAVPEFHEYLTVMMAGLVGTLGYNINAGILQGLGDSKTPLLFLGLASVMNIILDLVFVLVVPWGAMGVAVATVMSQCFSWLFGIYFINRKYSLIRIRPFSFRFDATLFKRQMTIGLPISLQQALFSIGTMLLLRLVNSYGSDFVAGFNAANKIDALVFLPIQSISNAITTYTGQNMGAGKIDRVRKGAIASVSLSVGISFLTCAILWPTGEFWMGLFSSDPAVIASGMAYLVRILPFYWMLAVSFVLMGLLRGAGETVVPMISAVLSLWLARVPSAYVLAHFFGAENMHYCYAIGFVVGFVICTTYYLSGKWKQKRIVH